MTLTLTGRSLFRPAAFVACAVLVAAGAGPASAAGEFEQNLKDIQHRWAEINYRVSGKAQRAGFEELLGDTRTLVADHPGRAEALIWRGIVASSYAGVKGPFGAMSLAKEARKSLEAAESIDPTTLDGSVYTSLGVLYYKVPGGLIGFGDKQVARQYLEKALAVNPNGIDPNYFYGEFLFEEEQYEQAREALLHAREAPPRPERPLADLGRRNEIAALLHRINAKLGRES